MQLDFALDMIMKAKNTITFTLDKKASIDFTYLKNVKYSKFSLKNDHNLVNNLHFVVGLRYG